MVNCKQKGNRAEREMKKALESAGFSCTKSGGSLGEFDLVCLGKKGCLLIQCKSNRMPGKQEMNRLFDFDNYPVNVSKFHKILAIKFDHQGWKIRGMHKPYLYTLMWLEELLKGHLKIKE